MMQNRHKERQSTAVIIPGLWTAFLFALENFAFFLGGVLSAMTAWGRGQAHIPRRAGGERFVMPSFPAGVCLALPVVCTVLAGSCILFMVSLESATEVRQ